MRSALVALVVLTAAPTNAAWALSQNDHSSITERACTNAGLPYDFCKTMATAAHSVDGGEWDDMAAHAQREPGQPACDAADLSSFRVSTLANEGLVARTAGADAAAAEAFGRALHTLQDECAHHGMTNLQHAHYSLRDVCGESGASPDSTPEAKQCAVTRTNAAMGAIVEALRGQTIYYGCGTENQTCGTISGPSPMQVCEFLDGHDQWDGVDTRWAPVVGDRLLASFKGGLRGDQPVDVCAAGDIVPARPPVLPHQIARSCTLISIGCLGKVDEGGGPVDPQAAEGGCSSGSGATGLTAIGLLGLVGFARRRNR